MYGAQNMGYFIDLDACRARSLQQKNCRRCFASLIQVAAAFSGIELKNSI